MAKQQRLLLCLASRTTIALNDLNQQWCQSSVAQALGHTDTASIQAAQMTCSSTAHQSQTLQLQCCQHHPKHISSTVLWSDHHRLSLFSSDQPAHHSALAPWTSQQGRSLIVPLMSGGGRLSTSRLASTAENVLQQQHKARQQRRQEEELEVVHGSSRTRRPTFEQAVCLQLLAA